MPTLAGNEERRKIQGIKKPITNNRFLSFNNHCLYFFGGDWSGARLIALGAIGDNALSFPANTFKNILIEKSEFQIRIFRKAVVWIGGLKRSSFVQLAFFDEGDHDFFHALVVEGEGQNLFFDHPNFRLIVVHGGYFLMSSRLITSAFSSGEIVFS